MLLNIQALRALAAIMVVVHHLGGLLAPLRLPEGALFAGASGVDIFFVISGFVMVHSVAARPLTPTAFYVNRLVRVAPLYWFVTIGLASAAIALPHLFRTVNATPIGLLKSLAFVPYLNGTLGVVPVLHVGWTLNYEMFFYAVFSLALAGWGRDAIRTAIAALCALIGIVIIGAIFHPANVIARFYTDPILIEFGFGMMIAMGYRFIIQLSTEIAVIMLLSGFVVLLVQQYVIPSAPRFIGYGIPAALIVGSSLALGRGGFAARSNVVQLLGASSYALYLIHPILLAAGARITGALSNPVAVILAAASLIAVVIVTSIAFHKVIELPMTRILRRKFYNRQPVV